MANEISEESKKALMQRLEDLSFPKLIAAFLGMAGITALDLSIILDPLPFIDEATFMGMTGVLFWTLVRKFINEVILGKKKE